MPSETKPVAFQHITAGLTRRARLDFWARLTVLGAATGLLLDQFLTDHGPSSGRLAAVSRTGPAYASLIMITIITSSKDAGPKSTTDTGLSREVTSVVGLT